ncbi:hypothetical protein [Paraglaciecola sp.]|uniref:hypothetical protein n=1 Tax=Paraglaciecola sp. TaxID=1920173 RepID=UPI0030F40E19
MQELTKFKLMCNIAYKLPDVMVSSQIRHLSPKSLELQLGGKRLRPMSLAVLSDWGE